MATVVLSGTGEVQDTYLVGLFGTEHLNYGAFGNAILRNAIAALLVQLVRIDSPSLIPAGTINSFTLDVRGFGTTASTLDVKAMKKDWIQGTKTGQTSATGEPDFVDQFHTATTWQQNGATGANDREATIQDTQSWNLNELAFKTFDLDTALAVDWRDGARVNGGVHLQVRTNELLTVTSTEGGLDHFWTIDFTPPARRRNRLTT